MARTPYLALLVLAGCGAKEETPYPDYAPKPIVAGPSSGFRGLVDAAMDAEAAGSAYRTYVSFTSDERSKLKLKLEPALQKLRESLREPVEFQFLPRAPFTPGPNQTGWRLLGRVLNWRIEDACKEGRYSDAIKDVLLATRFGWTLAQGSATDASLGFEIINDSRERFASNLDALKVDDLNTLEAGLAKILGSNPGIDSCLKNEHENMLSAVQFVQDAYKANTLNVLLEKLGPDARAGVKFLSELKQKKDADRLRYFEAFRAEADVELQWQVDQAALPAAKRDSNGPRLTGERPWQVFAKHFFTAGRRILPAFDAALARTRLFAINASLRARTIAKGRAPSSLTELKPELLQDPYSGGTFVYRADGLNFKVYSVGPNFQDDGGQTDARFERPDLILEGR